MLASKVMAMLRQMTVGSLISLAMKSTELLRISLTLVLTLIMKLKLILTRRRQLTLLTQVLLPNLMRRTTLIPTLKPNCVLTWMLMQMHLLMLLLTPKMIMTQILTMRLGVFPIEVVMILASILTLLLTQMSTLIGMSAPTWTKILLVLLTQKMVKKPM